MIPGRTFFKPGYYDSVGGKVHTGARMPVGQNATFSTYWGRMLPYINLVKSSTLMGTSNFTADPGTDNGNGYYDCSTSGFYRYITHSNWAAAGTYVLRWTGTGVCSWTLGTLQTPASGDYDSDGTQRREYVVSQAQADAVGNTWVHCTADGGGGQLTNVELFIKTEETSLDAGNILSTTFKSDMAGTAIVRTTQCQATNQTGAVDYADVGPYTNATWTGYQMPFRAMAEMAMELDCNLWCHIPNQFTDAAITSACTDLDTYYTKSGGKVYLERSNEVWNTAAGFNEATQWYNQYDIAHQDGVVTPSTASVAATAHGMTTGDSIRCFLSTPEANSYLAWPYVGGGQRWIIKDDNDTFRLASSEANANNLIDVAPLTGNQAITALRFKPETSAKSAGLNFGDACVEMWDLAEAQLGTKLFKVACGQLAGGSKLTQMKGATGFDAGLDGWGVAPYLKYNSDSNNPGWENDTVAELTTYMQDTYAVDNVDGWFANNISILGHYRILCYESGEENTGAVGAKEDKVLEWARSAQAEDFYDWYWNYIADKGILSANHYESHRIYSGSGAFGSMEHPGDTDAPKWLGIKTVFDAGGASKN